MTTSFTITDANFSQVITSLTLPNRSGLVAEYLFGDTQAKTIVNRAGPSLPSMTVVGSPVIGSNYAEIRSGATAGSHGFDSGMGAPIDATLLIVVRNTTPAPVWMGSYISSWTGFVNFGQVPALYNASGGTLTSNADVANPVHTDFAFYAGQMPSGAKQVIYTYTAGVLTTNTAETNGGITRDAGTIKFGTTITSVGIGIARVAYAAMFSRILSAAEIDAAYLSLKSYLLSSRSVVIS